MNRKFLFKAQRKDNREWVEGYLVPFCVNTYKEGYELIDKDGINYDEFDGFNPSYISYEIDPTTLSQFIGWKDGHDNRIFENDIVEIVSSPTRSEKYLIWWNREMSMLTAVPLDGIQRNGVDYYNHVKYHKFTYETFCLMMQDPWGDFRDIKVIGNLFDNPEMIEVNRWKD